MGVREKIRRTFSRGPQTPRAFSSLGRQESSTAVDLSLRGREPVSLSNTRFLKELIHVGHFTKYDQKSGKELYSFDVDVPLLNHWCDTHHAMLSDLGDDAVPVPLEHTDSPEKNRAFVRGMRLGKNSDGVDALFGVVDFRDEESAKLAKSANVSIHVPPQRVMSVAGQKREYIRPITHVALTNYPVIAKLDNFQAIACSLAGEAPLTLGVYDGVGVTGLAKRLGIPVDSLDDETSVSDKVVNVFLSMKTRLDALEERLGIDSDVDDMDDPDDEEDDTDEGDDQDDTDDDLVDQGDDSEGDDTDDSDDSDDEESDDSNDEGNDNMPKNKKGGIPSGVMASLGRSVKRSRELTLNSLVQRGHITKASRDKLASRWLSDTAITLSLSDESAEDEFNELVTALSLNQAVRMGESTGAQSMSLGEAYSSAKREISPLVANAERRLAASKNGSSH